MITDPVALKAHKIVQVIAAATMVAAPIAFLGIAWLTDLPKNDNTAAVDMTFYILLVLALVLPLLSPVIEKIQKAGLKNKNDVEMTRAQLYHLLSIPRMALVEATYAFGLAIYLLSSDLELMFWFYPIGIIWTLILWPRRKRFERFMAEGEQG